MSSTSLCAEISPASTSSSQAATPWPLCALIWRTCGTPRSGGCGYRSDFVRQTRSASCNCLRNRKAMSSSAPVCVRVTARNGSTNTVKGAIRYTPSRMTGMQDGCGDVRATPDRLCKDHIRCVCQHCIELNCKIGEPAAKAASRYFAARYAAQFCQLRVHQRIALIIQNSGATHAAVLQFARGGKDESGLAGTQKAANERRESASSARLDQQLLACCNHNRLIAVEKRLSCHCSRPYAHTPSSQHATSFGCQ